MNSSLTRKITDDLAEMAPTPEALAGVFGDLIKMQLLFSDILAVLPVNMLLTDDMGKVLTATPKLLREVLHRSREEAVGQLVSDLLLDILADDRQVLLLDNALLSGAQWAGEAGLKEGGNIGMRLCPLSLADSRVSVLLIEPLDEQNGGFWLNRLMYKNDENNELALRGRMTGGVLHEVKNIIQNFSALVQLMELETPADSAARPHLQLLGEQIGMMDGLINNYMGMGNYSFNLAEVSLNKVVRDSIRLIGGSIRMKSIEVFDELAPDLSPIYLDSNRIMQVLINCLDNSMDAIVERRGRGDKFFGEITVKTFADAGRGEACISIEDNGVGLTPEAERRFFEPFFTTKANGNGIGTNISRTIIKMHGGVIEAANRPEGGCRLLIRLPFGSALAEDNLNIYEEMLKLDE